MAVSRCDREVDRDMVIVGGVDHEDRAGDPRQGGLEIRRTQRLAHQRHERHDRAAPSRRIPFPAQLPQEGDTVCAIVGDRRGGTSAVARGHEEAAGQDNGS
jgi:hypothetical protein